MRRHLLSRLRPAEPLRPEAGETLIEVLISSALMGLLVVAIVGGFSTVLMASRVHRNQADANVSLVEAMEKVRAPENSRVCAANDASHPYRSVLPAGVSIVSIEYQSVTTDGSGNPAVGWTGTCDLSSPSTLQRITLQYTHSDSTVTPQLSFVKGAY